MTVRRAHRGGMFLSPLLLILHTLSAADRLLQSSGHRRFGGSRMAGPPGPGVLERFHVGSVIKKRRKRMAKKKHRKLLKKTRVQRRKLGK